MPDNSAEIHTHIFFSPHLDDVILSCGGWVAACSAQGMNVEVITVFAGDPPAGELSAFARHIHAKWRLPDAQAMAFRRQEDLKACQHLGVQAVHWEFLDAIYRKDDRGQPFFCSYESLKGMPESSLSLRAVLLDRIKTLFVSDGITPRTSRIYFPLGLAGHVDHQLLAWVGREIAQMRPNVWFYEAWPYLESFRHTPPDTAGWQKTIVPVDLQPKLESAVQYTSQIHGLGGTASALKQRLRQAAQKNGQRVPAEICWFARTPIALQSPPKVKLLKKDWHLSDFRVCQRTLKDFTSPRDIIQSGQGVLIDAGCGDSRFRALIEAQGYDWFGFDLNHPGSGPQPPRFMADAHHLPLADNSVSAALSWCVLAYLSDPQQALQDARRVLKPGGLVMGMAAFLEPVHGRTFHGLSPLGLRQLLQHLGYEDIHITPGINGFTLMLWTFLRRLGKGRLARLAFPITQLWLLPLMSLRFLLSWLRWRFGKGGGFGMQWVTRDFPRDFAGHLMFTARKGRNQTRGQM